MVFLFTFHLILRSDKTPENVLISTMYVSKSSTNKVSWVLKKRGSAVKDIYVQVLLITV